MISKNLSYNHTIAACSISYAIQAIVNNYAPLLFVVFNRQYHISLEKISLLITINFFIQLIVDFSAAVIVKWVNYRTLIKMAHIFAIVGFWLLAFLPDIMDPFIGLVISVAVYAVGGGLLEVLISPVVEAGPDKEKSKAMSFLHSFYSWGQMLVILVSTIFFFIFGIENRKILTILWTLIPIFNLIYFSFVPINTLEEKNKTCSMKELFKNKTFYFMFLLMMCGGASELGISQWASAFAETALKVSKTTGDILGPCMFALFMGISRILYTRKNNTALGKSMLLSAFLCLIGYLLSSLVKNPMIALLGCAVCGFSVGIMWPGTYVLAHEKIPFGGTALFALLALAGDVGCTAGPTVIGFVSSFSGDNLKMGILAGSVFPAIMILILLYSIFKTKKQ